MSNLNLLTKNDIEEISKNSITFKKSPNCKEGMLLIYADWCPHCVQFKPDYEYLTKMFNDFHKNNKYVFTDENNKNITLSSKCAPKLWAINHTDNTNLFNEVEEYPSIYVINNIKNNTGTMELFGETRTLDNILKVFKHIDIQK